jgi:hypothetical protein
VARGEVGGGLSVVVAVTVRHRLACKISLVRIPTTLRVTDGQDCYSDLKTVGFSFALANADWSLLLRDT